MQLFLIYTFKSLTPLMIIFRAVLFLCSDRKWQDTWFSVWLYCASVHRTSVDLFDVHNTLNHHFIIIKLVSEDTRQVC